MVKPGEAGVVRGGEHTGSLSTSILVRARSDVTGMGLRIVVDVLGTVPGSFPTADVKGVKGVKGLIESFAPFKSCFTRIPGLNL